MKSELTSAATGESPKKCALATSWLRQYRVWRFIKLCRTISHHWWNYVIILLKKKKKKTSLLLWNKIYASVVCFVAHARGFSPTELVLHFSLLPRSLFSYKSMYCFHSSGRRPRERWREQSMRERHLCLFQACLCVQDKEVVKDAGHEAQRHTGSLKMALNPAWHKYPSLEKHSTCCLDLWSTGLNYWAGHLC